MNERFDLHEFAQFFGAAWLAASAFMVARVVGFLAKNPVAPGDPAALVEWRARRRWFLLAEFAALPAMALVAAVLTLLSGGSTVVALGAGIVAGGVGFPFLVGAIKDLVRRRIDGGA